MMNGHTYIKYLHVSRTEHMSKWQQGYR